MAEFRVRIQCMWNSETSDFEKLAEEEAMQDNDDKEEEGNESG